MSETIVTPFANVVAELCSSSQSDIIRSSFGDSLVVPERSRALTAAIASHLSSNSSTIVLTPTHSEAESLAGDLTAFVDSRDVELLPAWETLPFERVSPGVETMGHRCRVQSRMSHDDRPRIVVASVRAAIQKVLDTADFHSTTLVQGAEFDRDELLRRFVDGGYSREFQVEARGECAVRGSIVDIFPSTSAHPIRIEFWGDTVERLSYFSIADQRSSGTCDSIVIYPARELILNDDVKKSAGNCATTFSWAHESFLSIAEGRIFDGMESFLPFLTDDKDGFLGLIGENDNVIVCDPLACSHRMNELRDEETSLAQTLSVTWDAPVTDAPSLFVDLDDVLSKRTITLWPSVAPSPDVPAISGVGFDTPRGDNEELARRLKTHAHGDTTTVLVSDSVAGISRMSNQLGEYGVTIASVDSIPALTSSDSIYAVVADIEHGVICSTFGLSIITDHELAGHRHVRRTQRGSRRSIQTYDDLAPGDYVVHHHHGVGIFEGLETKSMVGVTREYLILSFKGSDKLFVPSDQVGLVRKYIGGDKPSLNRLGGTDFEKTRRSVRSQVNLIAQELVVLYRKRLHAPGFAFSPDTSWQKEMEDLFPYELTRDQKNTIDDVKRDMELDHPMDRLVCGDVGFGKTEVALRAAFKATQDSKQVAVLVPTTLLATQHGHTFAERFSSFGLRVEVLSRFKTAKEQRLILDGLKDGTVDVVVGTHRLLSKDCEFKNLGLLVVDEEQRFGVTHKESIKKFATNVDVLTLTATPIPRTLEMSLTGIRDMSMITTPPADRQPILTYVHEYDERAVAEAIRRELLREGQVFFIHNRVRDLENVADTIRDLVPEARVVTAHGQIAENRLEKIVEDFYERKYDVLIATTIVESGLDLPAVNTLIVDRADALGLAQLYQLRGRVGRRGQRAYAYLFSPKNQALSHEAYERLKTIGEFTELGSGFKIAMRDLEIRGAGSLLGDVQSGHIAAVGFDLYCEMVTEAIDELNGKEREEFHDVTIDVPGDALVPESYVAKQDHRFDIYRRLSTTKTHADVDAIKEELIDRFGPMPEVTSTLIDITHLRIACQEVGISSIVTNRGAYRLVGVELPQSKQIRLKRIFPGALYKPAHALGPAEIVVTLGEGKDRAQDLSALIAELFDDGEVA